ncbi:hypothetical protein VTL71DRAFT_10221 [Oculimacula yallundae]|uniref:DUF7888 domain-containing protein n=1 Tax=Oculimacula yallundae TaxID=86028 RepID=A0ABR4BPL1_9HELO
MQFSTITLLFGALTANAATIPVVTRDAVASTGFETSNNVIDSPIEKRQAIVTGILVSVATTALSQLTTAGVNAAIAEIKNIANFDAARQAFTKSAVSKMAAANTDKANFPGTICYNQGYRLQDPAGFTGLVSLELKSGLLKVDFDCFYMSKGNAFFSEGDGGFQNLATNSPAGACTFDSVTADLRC